MIKNMLIKRTNIKPKIVEGSIQDIEGEEFDEAS